MPLPKITVKIRKDGREVARFRDSQGLVRTAAGITSERWVRADMIRSLADYGVALQLEQARAGIGSDGAPMPPLKRSRQKRWSKSQGRMVEYGAIDAGYSGFKRRLGLKPIRDLYGPGGLVVTVDSGGDKRYRRSAKHMQGRGHMLDDVRVNYVDDRSATIAITNSASRIKALANEQKAPWWGWSPASVQKLAMRAAEVFQTGMADYLVSVGIMSAASVASLRKNLRRVA